MGVSGPGRPVCAGCALSRLCLAGGAAPEQGKVQGGCWEAAESWVGCWPPCFLPPGSFCEVSSVLGVGGPGGAEGLASALRGWLRGRRLETVCAAHAQALGAAGDLERVWKGLTPCPWAFALLGVQMVVVNASSPVAACSGPWDARGMEESVATSDGNAESLYMQGTGTGWAGPPGTAQPGPASPPNLPPGFQPLLGRGQYPGTNLT